MKKILLAILTTFMIISNFTVGVFADSEIKAYYLQFAEDTQSQEVFNKYITSVMVQSLDGENWSVIVNSDGDNIKSFSGNTGTVTYSTNSLTFRITADIESGTASGTLVHTKKDTTTYTTSLHVYSYGENFSGTGNPDEDAKMCLDIEVINRNTNRTVFSESRVAKVSSDKTKFEFGGFSYNVPNSTEKIAMSEIIIDNLPQQGQRGGGTLKAWNDKGVAYTPYDIDGEFGVDMQVFFETAVSDQEIQDEGYINYLNVLDWKTYAVASERKYRTADGKLYTSAEVNNAISGKRLKLKNNTFTGEVLDEPLIESIYTWNRLTNNEIGSNIYAVKTISTLQVVCQYYEDACSSVRASLPHYYAVFAENYPYKTIALKEESRRQNVYDEDEGPEQTSFPGIKDPNTQIVKAKYRQASTQSTGWMSLSEYLATIDRTDVARVSNEEHRDASRYSYYQYGNWSNYYPSTEAPPYFYDGTNQYEYGSNLYKYRYATSNTTVTDWVTATPASGVYPYDTYDNKTQYAYADYAYSNYGDYRADKYGSYTGACRTQYANDDRCGVSSYKTCRTSACGVESYNSCRNSNAGCAAYKTCANSICGVYQYKSCQDSVCGVNQYKSCQDSACGVKSYKSCANSACGCAKKVFGICTKYNSCRTSACGVESYNSCRTSACGVQYYKSCRTSACGVESYKSCETSACGCDYYNYSRDSSCGVESYKSCANSACGANYNSCNVYSCPTSRTAGTYTDWSDNQSSLDWDLFKTRTLYKYTKTTISWTDWSSWSTSAPPASIYLSAYAYEDKTDRQVRARSKTLTYTNWYPSGCQGAECPRQDEVVSTESYKDKYGEWYQYKADMYLWGEWTGWSQIFKEANVENREYRYRLVSQIPIEKETPGTYVDSTDKMVGTLDKQTDATVLNQKKEMNKAYADHVLAENLISASNTMAQKYNSLDGTADTVNKEGVLLEVFNKAKNENAGAMSTMASNAVSGDQWVERELFVPYLYIRSHIRANYKEVSVPYAYSGSDTKTFDKDVINETVTNYTFRGTLIPLESEKALNTKVVYLDTTNLLEPLVNYGDELPENWAEAYEGYVDRIQDAIANDYHGTISIKMSMQDMKDMAEYVNTHPEGVNDCNFLKEFSYIFTSKSDELDDFLNGNGACRLNDYGD